MLPKLDGNLGPAHWLPDQRIDEMTDEVVLRTLGAKRGHARVRKWAIAAAIVVLLGATTAGFAMYALRRQHATRPLDKPARTEAETTPMPRSAAATESVAPQGEPTLVTPPALVAPAQAQSPRPSSALHRGEPRDLLQRANELRTLQRWREAAAAYERVSVDFPSSDEAYSAKIAAAALYAEHLARPRKALHLYAQALRQRPDGPLTQEARWGTIAVQRAIGDIPAERAAIEEFLAAYPDSLFRPQAQRRLQEISGTP